GMTFIGPTGAAMRMLGLKAAGKKVAIEAEVPVVPGTKGNVDEAFLKDLKKNTIEQIGYPVMIKASAGGGGKGMRLVHDPEQIEVQLKHAQAEAQASFGDSAVLIEKFVEQPRH